MPGVMLEGNEAPEETWPLNTTSHRIMFGDFSSTPPRGAGLVAVGLYGAPRPPCVSYATG
eukprot:4280663-Pyramimonas_sp.AAC.1